MYVIPADIPNMDQARTHEQDYEEIEAYMRYHIGYFYDFFIEGEDITKMIETDDEFKGLSTINEFKAIELAFNDLLPTTIANGTGYSYAETYWKTGLLDGDKVSTK